ncbi:MAG: hypothetical protein JW395_1308 [Nitrospira sp.]|nr:hypothetical protein [Nitrospira sp.]
MFNSKKRAMSKANKVLTATGLLKAAFAHDNDAMMEMVTGQTADDEGIWFALETFIGVAHRHPSVQDRLAELQVQMPNDAKPAFVSAIAAAEANNPRLFRGGNVTGQGLLLMSLTAAISEDETALADATAVLHFVATN